MWIEPWGCIHFNKDTDQGCIESYFIFNLALLILFTVTNKGSKCSSALYKVSALKKKDSLYNNWHNMTITKQYMITFFRLLSEREVSFVLLISVYINSRDLSPARLSLPVVMNHKNLLFIGGIQSVLAYKFYKVGHKLCFVLKVNWKGNASCYVD